LAITAAKLGARKVVAIDIDQEALRVARRNIRLNNVSKKVAVSAKPLDKIKGKFFIIFANIIAEELTKIASQLKDRLMDNGFLILSGILQERSHEVETAYKGLGFKLFKTYSKGEWVCLIFH
ncbi:MAG TPA: 50S ribosomal protein L11 methyltransferase, partial [Deltaproteobacteria bacterium]|nr:50S ribosomal protein L11 methyltransferase [Deltaproteobacteria bacterium]